MAFYFSGHPNFAANQSVTVMEIITFESKAYKELDNKITAIADYIFNHMGNGKAKRGRHVGGQLRGLHVPENKRKDPATPAGVGNYRLFQHQGDATSTRSARYAGCWKNA